MQHDTKEKIALDYLKLKKIQIKNHQLNLLNFKYIKIFNKTLKPVLY